MDMSWQEDAQCKNTDVESFYYTGITPDVVKRICAKCPVSSECLSHALRYERWGFWGGTTMTQRRELRKKMNILLEEPMYVVERG